jgi:hypothetical protein
MNFQPSEVQAAILDALARVLAPYRSIDHTAVVQRTIYATELEETLRSAGFFDLDGDAESHVTAALIVAEIARLPVCVEVNASLLVRPLLCPDAEGPIAIIHSDESRPTRFLPQARTALLLKGDEARILSLRPGDVAEVSSLFAYPVGRLEPGVAARAKPLPASAAVELRRAWRIGVALEIYGALQSASAITVEHVTQRRQFGKPLGSMQAIQHRLAMNATTIEAIRWLALKAASSRSVQDAAIASSYAQPAVAGIAYDVHQFSGAMGMTLEYPLHLYTYRARMLQSESGGGRAQIEDAVTAIWNRSTSNVLQHA